MAERGIVKDPRDRREQPGSVKGPATQGPLICPQAPVLHLWRLATNLAEPVIAALEEELPDEDQERARRFHFDKDRARFIASHAGMRRILAGYLGCAPGR